MHCGQPLTRSRAAFTAPRPGSHAAEIALDAPPSSHIKHPATRGNPVPLLLCVLWKLIYLLPPPPSFLSILPCPSLLPCPRRRRLACSSLLAVAPARLPRHTYPPLCALSQAPIPHDTMAGGNILQATADVGRVEAPVTMKAYLMCAFAAFGGVCASTTSLVASSNAHC